MRLTIQNKTLGQYYHQCQQKEVGWRVVWVDSEIYTFGGQSLNGTFNNNERYDPERNVWTTDLSMPTSRLGLESVSFENKIYVFGGKSDLGIVGANEIFYPRLE